MMKVFSLFTTALAMALALPPGMASAKDCVPTCGAMKRTCQRAAVGDFRSCVLDARANAPGGARRDAMRACRDAFRSARQSCLADLHGCLTECRNPPTGSCEAGCVATGKTCVQGVLDQGRSCAASCPPPGHDRGCRVSCAQQAKSGLEACASAVRDCVNGCGGTTTTTSAPTTTSSTTTTMPPSPSGAFLD
jgi:hypothetical protein